MGGGLGLSFLVLVDHADELGLFEVGTLWTVCVRSGLACSVSFGMGRTLHL